MTLVATAAIRKSTQTTCVRLTSGHVACTGSDQLGVRGAGVGAQAPAASVTLVRTARGAALDQVVGLETGGGQVCARRTGGSVYCWGNADQLPFKGASGTPFARLLTTITNAVQLSTSAKGTCAVLATGQVRCWGAMLTSSGPTHVSIPAFDPPT